MKKTSKLLLLLFLFLGAPLSAWSAEFVPLGIGAWETSGAYDHYSELLFPVGQTPDSAFYINDGVKRLPDGTLATPTAVWEDGFRDVLISDDGRVVTGQSTQSGQPLWFRFGPDGEMDTAVTNHDYGAGGADAVRNIDLAADGLRGAAVRIGCCQSRDRSFGRNFRNSVPSLEYHYSELPAPLASWETEGMGRLVAISGDGRVLVGSHSGTAAFRWAEETERFELLEGMQVVSDVSFDESVIVGGPSRWTEGLGAEWFGPEPTDSFRYSADAVSADGTVIAGSMTIDGQREAFRWTEAGGFLELVDLPGDANDSLVSAMSADGSTIVGYRATNAGPEPFLWNTAIGTQPLDTYLESIGADLAGYSLESITGVSGDGLILVGSGRDSQGREAAWLARIAIPEPTTAWLLTIVLLPCVSRHRF